MGACYCHNIKSDVSNNLIFNIHSKLKIILLKAANRYIKGNLGYINGGEVKIDRRFAMLYRRNLLLCFRLSEAMKFKSAAFYIILIVFL